MNWLCVPLPVPYSLLSSRRLISLGTVWGKWYRSFQAHLLCPCKKPYLTWVQNKSNWIRARSVKRSWTISALCSHRPALFPVSMAWSFSALLRLQQGADGILEILRSCRRLEKRQTLKERKGRAGMGQIKVIKRLIKKLPVELCWGEATQMWSSSPEGLAKNKSYWNKLISFYALFQPCLCLWLFPLLFTGVFQHFPRTWVMSPAPVLGWSWLQPCS